MPEQSETPQAVETPQQPAADLTPQQESREKVYERLYGQPEPAAATPPAQQAPPAVAEPDFKALYSQLASQVQTLIDAQAKPNGATPPQAPLAPTEDWFTLLQQGKRTEAEEVLKQFVAQGASQKIVQETLIQAMELNRMERDIEDFNNSVRASNPDMLDVEDIISLKAEKEFALLQPTIKNNKDYVAAYKKAVTMSVDNIRNLLRRTRAAAKNEAMTTRREVLASTTMTPNDIARREQSGDGAPQQPSEPDLSPTNYLEQRRAASAKLTGM